MTSTYNSKVEVSSEMPVKYLFSTSTMSSLSSEEVENWAAITSRENRDLKDYENNIYGPSGDMCTQYIPMSDSTVMRHVYYAYPVIKDPGINEALLGPERRKLYSVDGQELYLDLCEEMKLPPVRSFLRGLLGEVIDLKYYGVNPNGVRSMTLALTCNRHVRRLDLTSNFLNEDACYHLGQMLRDNFALRELILSGCRIQSEGLRRLVVYLANRPLEALDLSRNDIGDGGFEHLAQQFIKGAVIKRLNLSYNELTSVSASLFASSIEGNNATTHLDLSWNKMTSLKEVNELLGQLGDSKVLIELNISWNSIKISRILKKVLTVPTLRILDLSNNRLGKFAAVVIANNLQTAKSLHTLDLSYNPITAAGAFLLVNKLRNKAIKIINLYMDNVEVNKEFVKLSYRKKCMITHGTVWHDYTLSTPDIRQIVLKRMDYLTSHFRKGHTDIALYFLKKKKTCEFIQPREMMRDMKVAGTPLEEELVLALTDIFPGPKLEKGGKTMDLAGILEIIHRLWPERKLPPTPEPEPEPAKEPIKKDKKKSKKNK